jgi:predicted transcriptional regulator
MLSLEIRELNKEMVKVGFLIQSELRNQGRSVTWLAKQLNCDRTNIYKIFKRQTVDTALIERLSKIMKEDLFVLISESMQKEGGK